MKLALPLLFVALAGCAGIDAVDCGPDWYSTGKRDGRLGAQPQDENYARRCSGGVERGRYLEGWRDGVRERPYPAA